jgi:Zn-dependent M28 family amino/carboxypeptidase
MHRSVTATILGMSLLAACESVPQPPAGTDADTAAWWAITGDLSADSMEGRDTGSAGYDRAARYVADRFQKAGLKPAGDNGGWFQTMPLKEVRVEKDGTRFDIVRSDGPTVGLRFLHEITVRSTAELPATLDAPLSFRGYCSASEMGADMRGKVAVCFGGRRQGVPGGADRLRAAANVGALGLIAVDDPGFTIEPSRWPEAYARSITFRDAAPPASPQLPVMRLSADALERVVQGTAHNAQDILRAGAALQPLPTFDIPARIKASFALSHHEFTSDNVLGVLPGSDPALAPQTVIVSAHLDGYGFGEAVGGDSLYNGAFDDAAYVATLIRLAEQRQGKGFRRSVLFAVYTGEEKGLLGSNWFSTHLTAPKADLAAVINLDQIRPLFPLKILTMHAIADTTLANNVKRVASGMGIEIRPDLEPERNLNQRTDHWPFLRVGVPATNFVFGFDPGTDAEKRYREWYQVRYHRPQDDMSQPLDFKAAADMNTFFYRLTEDVANADERPAFLPGSPYKPN